MKETSRQERGWALVSVLCVVSMLALLAAATEELTLTSARVERASVDQAESDADFDAGFARALLAIGDTRDTARWRVDGIPQDFSFNGATMKIAVQDESGRFDLNSVDGETLTHLLQSAGLSLDAATDLSDTIQDWRSDSSADLSRLHGASDADYAARGYPWHPRRGPFQSIEELKLVMGVTPTLFQRLKPALTVYSKRTSINPQVAPREALRALFYEDPSKADGIIAQREEAAEHGQPTDTANPDLAEYGQTYTVAIDLYARGKHRHREIVAMLTGDDHRPYLIMAYR